MTDPEMTSSKSSVHYICRDGHRFAEPKKIITKDLTTEFCCPVAGCGAELGARTPKVPIKCEGMSVPEEPRVDVPENIKPHADDYKDMSWVCYDPAELGQWVALLVKRSTHRSNLQKRAKDLYDARNYLSMLDAQLSCLEDELFETLCGIGECPPSSENSVCI